MNPAEKKIYRVLDANHNRSKEALRVCEDVTRFVLESKPLSSNFKHLRHDLTRVLMSLPVRYRLLLHARNSRADIGRKSNPSNALKDGLDSVFGRNIRRAEESVRVLEECSRVISRGTAGRFQRIRFKLYELEKKTFSKF